MTNERAIELLNCISDSQFDGIHGDERREALEMAVRALEGDGDTISRKMAIDALMEIIDRPHHAEFLYTDEICRALNELPSAQPHWIPCSERLPEKEPNYVEYEVTIKRKDGTRYVTTSFWNNYCGRWSWDDYGVIAWRELSEPYGGENDDS